MKKAMLSHRFRENYLSSFLRFLEVPRRPVRPKAAAKLARIIPAFYALFHQFLAMLLHLVPFQSPLLSQWRSFLEFHVQQ